MASKAFERPIEEVVAADAFIQTLVPRADANNIGAPLWHGWALMDAFLAGIEWGRKNARKAVHP